MSLSNPSFPATKRKSHGRILKRYAKKVILIFDSDVAGVEAANRALDVCLAQRIDIK
ncbi:toprim domain-containing protein, partial [Planctomycetota bacterium]